MSQLSFGVELRKRQRSSGISADYAGRLMSAVMSPDHTPYDLRHTFATIGDQHADSRAVDCVMGHTSGSGVRDGYQHGVESSRLQAVAEFVRSRML